MNEQEFGDDLESVTEDELFVQRDESGELQPLHEEAPGLGEVKVLPMTYGAIRSYFGADTQMDDISSDDIAEILRNHLVEPDLSEVTGDDVENRMKPMVPQSLLLAVMKGSGVDVDLEAVEEGEPVLGEGN